ncbi:hypothetical protein Val02_29100 [Virgisporangium aliadipatigenens]|uniref:Sugar phosphate isomerase n=1 Tax=Virgisporangium aliadipatigenens TaxID=741659 RepID=A0A8J3YIQ1_9ACTN|nr:EboA domain-containing protein [Virgisporangium aliadipatigenens]GIJ46024.1 hypothetical protein Val02_29100 [Virgisporangium aliadipatigenens]
MTPDDLRAGLLGHPKWDWLVAAEAHVRADPDAVATLFARAERTLGRDPLPGRPQWTSGRAGRALLLVALARTPDRVDRITTVYTQGDTAERIAVLQALPMLPIGAAAAPLLHDALRTNDARLVAAALGPYAAHLDQPSWRQGVVKCVFMGIPLDAVDRLDERADAGLAAMLAALAEERTAAGRAVPDDALALLHRLTESAS